MRIRQGMTLLIVTILAVTTSLASADGDAASTKWGRVVTVQDRGLGDVLSVTTDNGMVVAIWSGANLDNLWISVRSVGQGWTQPVTLTSDAVSFEVQRDGKRAWVVWQNYERVSAAQVAADGAIADPVELGKSAHPFVGEPMIAAGAHGAVAAVWRRHATSPDLLAYRAPDGEWTGPEHLPVKGSLHGVVVGAAGAVQLVMTTGQGLVYIRRSPAGAWQVPRVVATTASSVTVAGNPHGDLVVGWQTTSSDKTRSLVARYRAAESGFSEVQLLRDGVPQGTYAALAMAGDGAVASAYRTRSHGARQIEMTPADAAGVWLEPQTLELGGAFYAISMNSAGDFVVTGGLPQPGLNLVRCPRSDECADTEKNSAAGSQAADVTLGPRGTITLVWGKGCHTEACHPTHVVAQRGR